ncbi:TIR domain-containing protein [Lentzea rhizosphaerae]|uniref:TIR domain-containing protein n=1 Tax=Lentzea rhizosphaerae TaxID=2041025 RepID=A0ABV8C6T5_9PSEU
MPGNETYAAFISYSHATDHELGRLLQQGIEKFAKPWYRQRARRVFLDDSVLAAESDLTQAILDGLAQSRNFLLLASPASALSPWVAKEVGWWLENRGRRTLFVLLTDGEAAWDNGVLDRRRTTALPLALHDVPEPRCVDLRKIRGVKLDPRNPGWESALADVVAPLDGIDKTELIGHHLRERRRTRRTITATISVLVVLLVAAVIFAVRSEQQSDRAQQQTLVATSRQLVAQAAAIRDTRPNTARQLLAQAYRMAPAAEVLGALMESPSIPRVVPGGSAVHDVAFSPRGDRMAMARDGGFALYEGVTERAVVPVDKYATAVAFSADGERVVATTLTGAVVVADTADPNRRGTWQSGLAGMNSVAFIANEPVVVVTGSGSRTWLLDVSNPLAPREIGKLPTSGGGGFDSTSAVSADGSTVALPGPFGAIELWDITDRANPKKRAVLSGHTTDVSILRFAPRGAVLASGSHDDTVRLWNTAKPEPYAVLSGSTLQVTALAFAPDGAALAVGDGNGFINLWDVTDPFRPRVSVLMRGHVAGINGLAFSQDSRVLASASEDGSPRRHVVRLWNVLAAARSSAVAVLPPGTTLAFGPDHLLASGYPMTLHDLSDVTRPKLVRTIRTNSVGGQPVAFSPDGTRLVTALPVVLMDPHSDAPPAATQTDRAESVVFSPDGTLIGAAPNGQPFTIWKRVGDQVTPAGTLTGSQAARHGISFSPDGRRAVTRGDKGQNLQLWDVSAPDSPKLVRTDDTKTDPVESVLFRPDGDVVVTGSSTGLITMRHSGDGSTIATASRHVGSVANLALRPDGKLLASAGESGEIVLWDAADAERLIEVGTLRAGGRYSAASIAFSPDGTMLGGADGQSTMIWSVDVPELLGRLCEESEPIPESEWRQYLPDVPYDPPCA